MAAGASFAELARRADAGEALTVVFLGCSLTWGANSTDPVERSYRAHVTRRLRRRWPRAQWTFIDAAIGGTDSRIGAIRFDRDVARHRPDLVLIDFTLNDGPATPDPDRLASYEAIVRRAVEELGAPLLCAILCGREMVASLDLARWRTRTAHLAIAAAYGCAVGDALALMQERLRQGRLDLDAVWDDPADPTHPGDPGYELYAEAVWSGLETAVAAGSACAAPERMLHPPTYLRPARVQLAGLPLPPGWSPARPTRIAAWYDSLMSRWLDSEVRAVGAAAAWELRVRAATIMLAGERGVAGGGVRALIDGRPAPGLPDGIVDCRSRTAGTVHLFAALATGLDPAMDHTLRLEPIPDAGAEWRFEGLWLAGGDASARPA